MKYKIQNYIDVFDKHIVLNMVKTMGKYKCDEKISNESILYLSNCLYPQNKSLIVIN